MTKKAKNDRLWIRIARILSIAGSMVPIILLTIVIAIGSRDCR